MFAVVKCCAGMVIEFGFEVYFLPILIAEKGLGSASIAFLSDRVVRRGILAWDLSGSDGLHWGDGLIMVDAVCI